MCLDFITDLMSESCHILHASLSVLKPAVIVIPVYLMSTVKIKTRQKLGIGFFLCLSSLMVVIEVVRISGVYTHDFQIWADFWIQIEGCTAVLTVSLAAFRTLFISDHSSGGKEKENTGWSPSFQRLLKPRKGQTVEGHDEAKVLITFPHGTMTSMRNFIGESHTEKC